MNRKTYTISQLARAFGLSRSTLLYYDRIELLCAPERTAAGYRLYTRSEYERLERICMFRGAGLPLEDVKRLLTEDAAPTAAILENRLKDLEAEIARLRSQQLLTIAMLREMTKGDYGPVVDKEMWVAMLESAGMDEEAMTRWHAEFEARAPGEHHAFLVSLGIDAEEIRRIRALSAGASDGE